MVLVDVKINEINGTNDIEKKNEMIGFLLDHIKTLDKGQKFIALKKLSNATSLTLEELKKDIEETKFHIDGLMINDYQHNVEQFYKAQQFFYDRSKMFWFWDNNKKMYKIVDETDIMVAIDECLGFKGQTVSSQNKSSYLEAFKRVGRRKIPETPPTDWVQFKDKIINITSSEEFEASPDFFFTNPIPWNIGENEDTPNMDKIFTEWVGADFKETLYEILAFSMLTDYPIHRLFCFIGSGMNGKSKYLELVSRFIGHKNITTTELDVLLKSKFETTRLHKKLVCMMGETNFNQLNKTSMLKKLTGQDMIGYEYKNKDLFEDYNYAKIFIATNNLPATGDKTDGFYRRWLIIDFPNRFSEKKDILGDIPNAEYNNLALKCIRILRDLLKRRTFTNEGTIEERKKMYEDKSNPFDKFWNENIIEDYDGHISKKDFKRKLDDWCKEKGFRNMSERTISNFMKEKGIFDGKVTADWVTRDGDRPRYMAWNSVKWA
jgi:P4 family phage/plasmid primase-like protien